MRYTEARLTPIARLLLERDRRRHCRLHAELRRLHAGAAPAARAAALRAAQRRLGHRRRHGHRDSVAQPARSRGRHAAPDEGPKTSLEDVLRAMPGPDFPGGGQLISSAQEIRDVYASGRGSLKARGASRVRGTRARAVAARSSPSCRRAASVASASSRRSRS